MKKTLVISVMTLALTGMGASPSFASSKNVSATQDNILQSKAAIFASDGKIIGDYFPLEKGEVTKKLNHKKDANMRVSITNNSNGGVHWFLKNPNGTVYKEGDLAKGATYNNTFKLKKGTYQLRVVSDINGTGPIYIGARTME
ncbi:MULTISPECIES: hypothetical protein [Bacillus]|uniref:hypothetical protein n=1 Tax=Bacillus TaxID=1386 RepID=UPI000BF47894|nr:MULTISPECIES: hypothetical protein [Bacillus]MDR4943328.1 hypothetical protein [Bacillus wiedmannii]PEU23887.1 hypothetical protein CN532_23715 [Bacillus wiedmannii]PGD51530.1 hypothetical protein COM40_27725 [Bacillus wiedmannii]PHB10777.1 hypothetical protein COE84_20050 [Bacillus wiedmannii]UNK30875.1 hypothetical protein MNO09_01850 [Bacillus sp. N5-665]